MPGVTNFAKIINMTKVIICEAVLSSTDQIAPETMLGPFLLSLLFKVTPFYYLKGFNNLTSPHEVFYYLKIKH